ncbi:hyaluronidase-3 isoform X2 [Agelaius phoeniceus]|uniref:hyaluronidase-3 isoform X2 n=1 Tax=Agelaius phoeniceus TaxID=39638 RepID=UPI0040553035
MVLVLALWACLALGTASEESPAPEPLAGGQPFAVVWNVPTERCQHRFGIGLPLGDYGIVENQGGHFAGQNITIFYKNKFGLYPYLSQHGVPHNGGLPQRVSLDAHINRVVKDIRLLLRPAFHGLAVVDWEEWRPLWAQNWGAKRMYRTASEEWVREQHGILPARQQLRLAQLEFEQAAQALMEETLLVGRALRPGGLWGFYRFPDCLNSNWAKEANYTGQCQPAEVQRNNRLGWLWAASSALYPSIYLPLALPPALRRRFVHHRLREALRVAALSTHGLLPVIAYSRLSFRRSSRFLQLADLVHTIGESAALGAAGLVLWGDLSYSRSATAWEGPRVLHQQSLGTLTAVSPEPSACAPWSPSVTCTGPRAGTRAQRAMARLPPAACTGPQLGPCPPCPRRSCPPCAPCPPPAPAPASALATPCCWPCWRSWHCRAWSWPPWPST